MIQNLSSKRLILVVIGACLLLIAAAALGYVAIEQQAALSQTSKS